MLLFKKHILIFLFKFAAVYAVLLLPGFRNAYMDFYNSTGEKLFGSFGSKGMVRFKEKKGGMDEDVQTIIYLINKNEFREKEKSNTPVNTAFIENNWLNDYLPVAFLLSLNAATPMGWRRKLISLAAGLVIMHIFIFFSMWISFLFQFNLNAEKLQVVELGLTSTAIAGFLYEVLSINPGT